MLLVESVLRGKENIFKIENKALDCHTHTILKSAVFTIRADSKAYGSLQPGIKECFFLNDPLKDTFNFCLQKHKTNKIQNVCK